MKGIQIDVNYFCGGVVFLSVCFRRFCHMLKKIIILWIYMLDRARIFSIQSSLFFTFFFDIYISKIMTQLTLQKSKKIKDTRTSHRGS